MSVAEVTFEGPKGLWSSLTSGNTYRVKVSVHKDRLKKCLDLKILGVDELPLSTVMEDEFSIELSVAA